MSSTKVSYVMATVRDDFIHGTYQSILNQTFKDWELIIVDTKVRPMWKFMSFADKRVKVVSKDLPSTDAYNLGRTLAQTNIILHISDDDIDLPNRAELCYTSIMDGADIFLASYDAVYENLDFKRDVKIEPFNIEKCKKFSLNMPLMCGAFRNDKAPYLNPKFYYLADYLFFMESYKKGLNIVTSKIKVSKVRDWKGRLCANTPTRQKAVKLEKEGIEKIIKGLDI